MTSHRGQIIYSTNVSWYEWLEYDQQIMDHLTSRIYT
jgi:hypothetical protein